MCVLAVIQVFICPFPLLLSLSSPPPSSPALSLHTQDKVGPSMAQPNSEKFDDITKHKHSAHDIIFLVALFIITGCVRTPFTALARSSS